MTKQEILKLFEERFPLRLYDEYKQEKTEEIKDFIFNLINN